MGLLNAENTAAKQRGRPFRPGQSGNPGGRPKGARNRSTVAAEALLVGEAEALTRKAIELAKAGDTTALRLCLERVVPPRKDRPISLELPVINSADDANRAMRVVLAAVGEGRITLSEATNLAALIEVSRSSIPLEPPPSKLGPVVINVQFVKAETACIQPEITERRPIAFEHEPVLALEHEPVPDREVAARLERVETDVRRPKAESAPMSPERRPVQRCWDENGFSGRPFGRGSVL
jgi:hypothetical protein